MVSSMVYCFHCRNYVTYKLHYSNIENIPKICISTSVSALTDT
jgi:hypothetical protein